MNFSVSWAIKKFWKIDGGTERVSTWEDVWSRLSPLQTKAGSASLDIMEPPDLGPLSMGLIAANGHYLITLLELEENGLNVRDYTNPEVEFEMVDLLGDMWDSRLLTSDFNLVYKLFEEFFRTGDVSKDWLE